MLAGVDTDNWELPFWGVLWNLKKTFEFADYHWGQSSGGALPDISGRPTCHPLFSPTLCNWTRKTFQRHRLKKKECHSSACFQLLCLKIAPHLETWTTVKWLKVCTFFSVRVWRRKNSTPQPVSNFRASYAVSKNCITFGNLDNKWLEVCTFFLRQSPRKNSMSKPISNFRASHYVYESWTTFGNLYLLFT